MSVVRFMGDAGYLCNSKSERVDFNFITVVIRLHFEIESRPAWCLNNLSIIAYYSHSILVKYSTIGVEIGVFI